MKVIPLDGANTARDSDDWPELSNAGSVAKEITVTRQLSELGAGRGMIRFKA
jgi:hypothetical protein